MARQARQTEYAAERARLLLGCYRTGDANDPDTYVAAVTAVLSRYPEEIVTEVTHPATGLPRQKSWLPTVKEVFDACQAAYQPILEREREARIIAETLASRTDPDKSDRPTLEDMKAKYGDNWGLQSLDKPESKPKPAPTIDQLRHHYQHYGLAFTPKNKEAAE
jgi:hypothetical protein